MMAEETQTEETWLRLTEGVLAVEAVSAFLSVPRAGGVCLFVGITRRWTGEAETVRLEYECYEAMALREMERLAGEAVGRWSLERVALHHRVGVVPVAEASVVVGASAPHRADAFAACRYLIDALKETVPIWKREVYADGRTEWIEGAGRKPKVE
jgi:molybdopterin synthase catalytic subunit